MGSTKKPIKPKSAIKSKKPIGTSKSSSPTKPLQSIKNGQFIPSQIKTKSSQQKVNKKINNPKQTIMQDKQYIDDDSIKLRSYKKLQQKSIISQKYVPANQLKIGDVVRMLYMSAYHPSYKAFPRPTVLILNPNWKGKAHGLALRFLTVSQIQKLKRALQVTISSFNGNVKSKSLLMNDPYKFYHTTLKKFLRSYITNSIYRTYFVTNMKGVTLLQFNFDKEVEQRVANKSVGIKKN